jgi:hypothetical protein
MKILGPMLAGAVGAVGAFAASYAVRPTGSAICTLVLGAFLAIFVLAIALSVLADWADRRRAARRWGQR